jgi:superfamily II DNA or RNA helicase
MTTILRPYQTAAIDEARKVFASRPLIVAPTGSGKTEIGAEIVRRVTARNGRVVWIAHRMELIEQARVRLVRRGLRVGVVMGGVSPDKAAPVQVASIQTLVRRELPPADVIVIDEAHHARARTYKKVLDRYPNATIIGLTATPFRTDGRGLGEVFGAIVVAATVEELIASGHLIRPTFFAPPGPDLRGLKKRGGDYSPDDLDAIMRKPSITGDVVKTWLARARGVPTACYATTIKHSQEIVEAFRAAGVRAEHLDGATPTEERNAILARLASGETTLVSNVMVLTEGWDLPRLGCAIVARPTASLGLHLQILGRVMRPAEDKAGAIVLDHAGNVNRHGLPWDPIEFSLDDEVRKKDPEVRTTKTCWVCYAVVPVAATACPCCGAPFGGEVRVGPERRDGDLAEFKRDPSAPLIPNASPEKMAEQYAALCRTANEKGYKPTWAGMRYQVTFGSWPRGLGDVLRAEQGRCGHVMIENGFCRFCGERGPEKVAPAEPFADPLAEPVTN